MANLDQPKWTKGAQDSVDETTTEFDENIRRIAIRFARHEKSMYVDPRHVHEAKDGLSRLGLNRRPWWKRPELEFGLGTGLIGSAFSVPDLIGLFSRIAEQQRFLIAWAIIAALVTIGVFFVTHGWLRGRH